MHKAVSVEPLQLSSQKVETVMDQLIKISKE
jgi:hypothetical protein